MYFICLILEDEETSNIIKIGETIEEKRKEEIESIYQENKCEFFWNFNEKYYRVKESYITKMERWI